MNKIVTVLCAILILINNCCNADKKSSQERTHDPTKAKEINYKKFIAERQYMLPFKTRIGQPFQEGQTIHALGTIHPDAKRITYNFHKGGDKKSDLPMHLSIRFDEGKMVYNTYQNGSWGGSEQRIKNPFVPNGEFDLRIRVINGKYQVFANRVEIGNFDQRQPIESTDHVSLSGDLVDLRLFHYGGRVFELPYTAVARLTPGKRLDVSLMPTGTRFNMNLVYSNREYALQVSARINEGAVVRNAMENSSWGREERDGGMPMSKGKITDVTIVNEPYSYQIFYNGKRFASFAHRGSPDDIETVSIDGDAEVYSVTVNNAVGI